MIVISLNKFSTKSTSHCRNSRNSPLTVGDFMYYFRNTEPKSFFEVTLNSIMHNKWTTEDGPSFTMFSDRSEILSIGVLLVNKTEEGFYRGDSIPMKKKKKKWWKI